MKIAFLGDVLLSGKFCIKNLKYNDPFNKICNYLKEFDLVVANLESPLTHRKKSNTFKSMHLKANPENIQLLKRLNITLVNLSNNHIYDFDETGLNDTIDLLNKNNINYFGVNGVDYIHNNSLHFSAFTCYSANGNNYSVKRNKGIRPLTLGLVKERLEKNKKNNFFSVLSFHWGQEYTNYPDGDQMKFINELIQKHNNFLIYGHHSHTIQPYIYNLEQNIAFSFSLGNFCFDEVISPFVNGFKLKTHPLNEETFVWNVTLKDGKIVDVNHIPLNTSDKLIKIDKAIGNKIDSLNKGFCIQSSYDKHRNEQIKEVSMLKFEKKSLKWYLARMNYFSIGFKLLVKINKYRYSKKFLK